MKRAAMIPAAFALALALATTDTKARQCDSDMPFHAEGTGTLHCIDLTTVEVGCYYPTVCPFAEEPASTPFADALSRFDAENHDIAISSRTLPAEDDPFALHAALPPRRSGRERIEPLSFHPFNDRTRAFPVARIAPIRLGAPPAYLLPPAIFSRRSVTVTFEAPRHMHAATPLVVVAPSTQRAERDSRAHIMSWPELEVPIYAEQEVRIISSGFSPEYGDCLCGPVNTCRGRCSSNGEHEEIAQPKQPDEQEHAPAPIAEPAPTPTPTLE